MSLQGPQKTAAQAVGVVLVMGAGDAIGVLLPGIRRFWPTSIGGATMSQRI